MTSVEKTIEMYLEQWKTDPDWPEKWVTHAIQDLTKHMKDRTITGRFLSKPNLQQIPIQRGKGNKER